MITERYELAAERIEQIQKEYGVSPKYRGYFCKTAEFFSMLCRLKAQIDHGEYQQLPVLELETWNRTLYEDILPGNYEQSFANPSYAVAELGNTYGQMLCFLYAELRCGIVYTFEKKTEYLTVLMELFIEIYNCFEQEADPQAKEIQEIIYWYASDYCDLFVADRIEEQIDPGKSFALDIIMNSDLDDVRYLYQFGEYISENELGTAAHLKGLSENAIQEMADVYTEGYRKGFVAAGKDLSRKGTVNIRYVLGFERVIKKAVENFEKMGLSPVIYRAAVSVLNRRQQFKTGYYGASANKQYEYDHRSGQSLFLDKRFVERKLQVIKNAYESNKQLAAKMAGPAVLEVFGECPFSPIPKEEAFVLGEKQEELALQLESRLGQMTNEYIPGDERSFTCIAYPVPDIGKDYKDIFDAVMKINTLDADVYAEVQKCLIDAFDRGDSVHIKGRGSNRTDLTIKLHKLLDPLKETNFENCVADVNIPVGEVFTSPVLEGTNGVLHVEKVYLRGLLFTDLEITFANGMVADYRCGNFKREQEGKKYIFDNILYNHKTLPLGEFAVGTNTTAYVMARKYAIEDKLPVLIAEKMGPHFAVGDTCYSWSEESRLYNPDGKEIIAKDNSVSQQRKTDIAKAYFHCHTDITLPYDEVGSITVLAENEKPVLILEEGRFVLPGTELLNEPLDTEKNNN